MPKKKGGGGGGGGKANKTQQAAKKKMVEDKTFGMKNKNKSSKAQKYIQQLQAQHTGTNDAMQEAERRRKKKEKAEMARQQRELGEIFSNTTKKKGPDLPKQKIDPNVDPKTVVCQFFKAGYCERGNKCKFSHDLNLEKNAKRNLYHDQRSEDAITDDAELKDAVEQAQQKREKAGKLPPTTIICKHFIEAVEGGKYGWFWKCPNGGDACHYVHALPPGYVLKSQAKEEEDEDKIPFEEELEIARTQLETRTPVTPELFAEWKKKKLEKKKKEEAEKEAKKSKEMKKGVKTATMTGRDLFDMTPDLFVDDVGASDDLGRLQKERRAAEAKAETDMKKASQENVAAAATGAGAAEVQVDAGLFGGDDEDLDDLDDEDLSDEEAMMARVRIDSGGPGVITE